MATKPRQRKKSPSAVSQLLNSSWTKVLSIILTLGAVAGVFWAADQHWVNFPFHNQAADLTLHKSTSYTKQLASEQALQLKEFASIIRDMQQQQKEDKLDARILAAQNQANFLLRQEISMREAMARLTAANKPISTDFKAKLQEVAKEREKAEAEVKQLRDTK